MTTDDDINPDVKNMYVRVDSIWQLPSISEADIILRRHVSDVFMSCDCREVRDCFILLCF